MFCFVEEVKTLTRGQSLTFDLALLTETSLNMRLFLGRLLNISKEYWTAAWISAESGLLSTQPPRTGSVPVRKTHF